jgi:KR domain/Phosphopantetheine attachment site
VLVDAAAGDAEGLGRCLAQALAARPAEGAPITGVLSLLAVGSGGGSVCPTGWSAPGTVGDLVEALDASAVRAPLWVATRNAVSISGFAEPDDLTLSQSALWGLGQVMAEESPASWGGLVDLPDVLDSGARRRLGAVLADGRENQVVVRGSATFSRRLVRSRPARQDGMWSPGSGTVLVSGATTVLGRHAVDWLVAHGADRLLLTVPSGTSPEAVAELEGGLTASGAQVRVVRCDPADRDALANVLESVDPGHPLSAVVHAEAVESALGSGALAGGPVDEAAEAAVQGVVHLDELTRGLDLAAFVLFSPVAGALGVPGLGRQASFQVFCDAVAHARRARGHAALSISWGPVAGRPPVRTGADEAQDDTAAETEVDDGPEDGPERFGLRGLLPEFAMEALGHAAGFGDGSLVVADVDWSRVGAGTMADRRFQLFTEVVGTDGPATPSAGLAGALQQRLAAASADERLEIIVDLVRSNAAAVLGLASADDVTADGNLLDLGFSSFTALELSNRLSVTGVEMTPVAVYDMATPMEIARHLLSTVAGGTGPGNDTAGVAAVATAP